MVAANGRVTILAYRAAMDEDQLYVDHPPYRPRPITEMIPAESFAERLAEPSRRTDVWRAALLGTLTGAAIVIGWIELIHRVYP